MVTAYVHTSPFIPIVHVDVYWSVNHHISPHMSLQTVKYVYIGSILVLYWSSRLFKWTEEYLTFLRVLLMFIHILWPLMWKYIWSVNHHISLYTSTKMFINMSNSSLVDYLFNSHHQTIRVDCENTLYCHYWCHAFDFLTVIDVEVRWSVNHHNSLRTSTIIGHEYIYSINGSVFTTHQWSRPFN